VGIAPRLFLRRLIDVLDRVEAFDDFDPAKDYEVVLKASEMTPEEALAAGATKSVDDIELDLGGRDADGNETDGAAGASCGPGSGDDGSTV
jgi:hypothetical protein